jgi:transposase
LDYHALARGKKNARRRRAWIAFQDESGVSQRPPVRRTWAPRGETPILIHAFNWKKLSVAMALAFRWDGRRSRLFFQTQPGSYNDVTLIGFLTELKRHCRGRRLILIWDGLPSHKSQAMTAYLHAQRTWLTVERLPGYAPELNPAELVWGNVKGRELANLCAEDLGDIERALRAGLRRVRRTPALALAFLRHAGLSF